jgi:polysaccharide biosynthesis transport protein
MEAPKTFGNNTPTTESKLHFLDYWRIIRIRKTVILAVFLLVVLTTTAVTFILPEHYASTVRIEVGKDTTDIAPLLQGMHAEAGFDPYFIQTEFEKIQSKRVIYQVLSNLNLIGLYSGRIGKEVSLKTNEAYQVLLKNVSVRQSRNTSLIEIKVYDEDPVLASKIANEIAEVYRVNRESRKMDASARSIKVLEQQATNQFMRVQEAQAKVDKLRQDLKVGDIDTGSGSIVQTLEPETVRGNERMRMDAYAQFIYYSAILNKLNELERKSRSELREAIPAAYPDTQLTDLLGSLHKAENEYAIIVNELGPEHVRFQSVSNLLANLNQQVDARVTGVLHGLRAVAEANKTRAEELQKIVDEARDKDAKKMAEYRPYFQAKQDLETENRIYETIRLRILQENVDAKLPKDTIVQVTDPAEPDRRPVRPNVPLNIALGIIVGLIMGFGLAFFIEYLDTSVKTIDDVERALQAPVLGVIPQNVGSLLDEGPDSPHAEAYRVLRTNLLFSRKDPKLNSLTVVSGGAGEGKSTTIFNLATVFAQNGNRVLVVDSDLRRPSLHKLLEVSNSIGLTNYLLKQNTLEEVVQTTNLPTLHFLPSGKLPSSSLGILNSTQMKEFIQTVKQRYDFVFFDSPPIMGVSDASILASEVDLSLLVIQYRKYPQAMTLRAKQMVEKVGGNLLGVVLNNINISQDSYYYYYSGYYYDYYSKHDDEASTKKNGESKPAAVGDRAELDLKKKY